MEDALYEIESMRHFASLKRARLPDETTILKFRHFLERHGLGKVLFQEVNRHLEKNGLMRREGSIVDASIRAKVEHPFRYIRQIFGYSKVRYPGLAKNTNRLHMLTAFTNLMIGEKYLLA